MKPQPRFILALLVAATATSAMGADQTVPGKGNAYAIKIASNSPLVQSAQEFLVDQARQLQDDKLSKEMLDAIANPQTCIKHRAGLSEAAKDQIVNTLIAEGLVNPADGAGITGGVKAGVFPPVLHDGTACPKLPQAFFSAPGSTYPSGHHSYPGGLPVHEANNETADVNLASEYRSVYGSTRAGWAVVDPQLNGSDHGKSKQHSAVDIDQDIIVAAPIWHDLASRLCSSGMLTGRNSRS